VVSSAILLIEDDPRLAKMVQSYLGGAGLAVTIAGNGALGLALLDESHFEVVLLDLTLPDIDGLDICRRLRDRHSVPILMMTARGEPMDRVVGLEIGADDYLPKPFEPRELLARVRALLRRAAVPTKGEVLRFGRLEIDVDARQIRLNGEVRTLTSYQFGLLVELARRAGRVLSRQTLMDLVNSNKLDPFDRSIDVHVSRIRAAIEDDPKRPQRLITVRGAGYVFARSQS
jgi:two-component system, OmpR family, phosphate regulon response regulator OmpR